MKKVYQQVIHYFEQELPNPVTELMYRNDYELVIAVVLSAQCTDKRVNTITPALFEAYPSFERLAAATWEEVLYYIASITYPNNKAKYLVKTANQIMESHGGKLPNDFESLTSLNGVGRKTANVLLSILYNQPAMAVDTHVFRVSQRIGLVQRTTSFLQVEKELTKQIPTLLIPRFHHWLILHGRYICKAQKPACSACGISTICKWHKKKTL